MRRAMEEKTYSNRVGSLDGLERSVLGCPITPTFASTFQPRNAQEERGGHSRNYENRLGKVRSYFVNAVSQGTARTVQTPS